MKIEIFDIDGTLTYVHGDITDTTGLSTYAFWPLITQQFTKDLPALNKMIATWEESMKTEQDPTGSSHRMMQMGLDSFPFGVTAEKIKEHTKELTLLFIKHGIIRTQAIAYLNAKINQGITCILSTGSYQDGAVGFIDGLLEGGLLSSHAKKLLHVSGAIVDWDEMKLLHANVRERKLQGIEKVMNKTILEIKPAVEAVYADDPWINDRDIVAIAPLGKAYVISTINNKEKILPQEYKHTTWDSIISQAISPDEKLSVKNTCHR